MARLSVKKVLFWTGALALPFVLIAALNVALGPAPSVAPQYLYQAALALESSAARPADLPAQGWQAVKLPGLIPPSKVRPSSGWFRITVQAQAVPDELWALYIERPFSNLAVFVNGVDVGASGPMTRPIPMYRVPLLFKFPGSLIRPGENLVEVRSLEADFRSHLDAVAIGPVAQLQPAYDFAYALAATYKRISVVVLLVLGAVFIALFMVRRREVAYAWFALGMFGWAMHIGNSLVPRSPFVPEILWLFIGSIEIGVFAIASAMFVNHHTQLRQPRIERAMLAFGVLGAVFQILDPLFFKLPLTFFVPLVWLPGLLLIGLNSLVQLLRALRHRPSLDIYLLLAGAWLLLVVGVRDLLIETNVLPWAWMYMPYTVGFTLSAVSAVLLHRFALSFDAAERARDELDERVRAKSAELATNLVRMKDLERERALGAERERILQDMHDGLGGHLVQALAIATSRDSLRPLEEPLRSCLDELRLMVDSLEPANGDLASVLGSLRPRISRRLTLAGVNIRWQVGDLPADPDLGPRKVLDVARVLQEAITNAIKHSGCNAIAVHTGVNADGRIEISVTDNGRGIHSAGAGHGLASMRRRTAALGGELTFEDASPGTRVTLRLPAFSGNGAANRNTATGQSPDQAQTGRPSALQS